MGAFIICDIGFKEYLDRARFEDKYKIKKKDILVSERSPCDGITWTFMRNPYLDIIYYFGFLGYAEPKHILRVCLKDKIRIKFFSWLPINDKQTEWTKERGRW